jgi:hypothetical protein
MPATFATLARAALPVAVALGASFAGVADAEAAPPWVYRPIVLPRHDWSFDVGLGLGHEDLPNTTLFGPGFNFDMAVAVTNRVELGFRSGVRIGEEAEAIQADRYGRLFDTETFGTGAGVFANPEFRVRGALVQERVVELALEGRMYLPFEEGTRVGFMFGVPLNFHFGRWGRLETGVNVPVLFYSPTVAFVSIPARLWFQVSDRVWLGPISAIRFNQDARPFYLGGDDVDLLLGFGLGIQLTSWMDFKTQILFPHIDDTAGARDFGVGAGLQFRIE